MLKRIREANWDTIAHKLVLKEANGRKTEVPIIKNNSGAGDSIGLQVSSTALAPNANIYLDGIEYDNWSTPNDTFELADTNPLSVLLKRDAVIDVVGRAIFTTVSGATNGANVSLECEAWNPGHAVGEPYGGDVYMIDLGFSPAVIGTSLSQFGHPAAFIRTQPKKLQAGSIITPLVSSGDAAGSFDVSALIMVNCLSSED